MVVAEDAARVLESVRPVLLVDAIIAKRNLGTHIGDAPAVVALGPGFVDGRDAMPSSRPSAAMTSAESCWKAWPSKTRESRETSEGTCGRVVWSPAAGTFRTMAGIGDLVRVDDAVGYVGEEPVHVALDGVLRGLLHPG